MPDHAQLWTANGLAVEFAMDRRTVMKRLEDCPADKEEGRSRYWKMRTAAPFLVTGVRDETKGLDPQRERARRDKEAADKIALENATTRRELVSVHEVKGLVVTAISEAKSRLLAVPTKAAPQVIGMSKVPQVRDVIEQEIHDALTSIAELANGHLGGMEPASEDDSFGVGGHIPEAERGSEFGTRAVENK